VILLQDKANWGTYYLWST